MLEDQSFTATANVRGKYHTMYMYDQGGLMLPIDKNNWIKCGVEYVDGQQFASVVVTVNAWSDWSVVLINAPEVLKLRVKREKEVVHIDFAEGKEGTFKMMRLAYLPMIDRSKSMMVGIMCASPVENATGFDIIFENLTIEKDSMSAMSESTRMYSHYMFLHAFISFLLSFYFKKSFFTREM